MSNTIPQISLKALYEKRDFYEGYIKAMENRKSLIDSMLNPNNPLVPFEDVDKRSALELELIELSAKITNQQQNLTAYIARVEMRMPEFEKESQETNLHFEAIYNKALVLSGKIQEPSINKIISDLTDLTADDPNYQEKRNDAYFNLKYLIELAGKNNGKMKIQR